MLVCVLVCNVSCCPGGESVISGMYTEGGTLGFPPLELVKPCTKLIYVKAVLLISCTVPPPQKKSSIQPCIC